MTFPGNSNLIGNSGVQPLWVGLGRPCLPYFNFRIKQGPEFSVSNISDIGFYGCSEIIRTRNFTSFTVYATIFGQFMAVFFLTTQEKQITSRWTFSKGPIFNAGPSEKFLFVDHPKEDHNKQEFKPQIIGEILDLSKNTATEYVISHF